MKFKSILLTAVATIGLTAATVAQVPNYVPTNGLVGWWPFNGNANDESGNGNNLVNNNSTYTNDRFNNINSAADLVGANKWLGGSSPTGGQSILSTGLNSSLSVWVKVVNPSYGELYHEGGSGNPNGFGIYIQNSFANGDGDLLLVLDNGINGNVTNIPNGGYSLGYSFWHNIVLVKTNNNVSLYVNGVFNSQGNLTFNTISNGWLNFGVPDVGPGNFECYIDDIGMWNRVLTQQEITDLFNAVNCANNSAITPQTNSLVTGSTATFTASTSDPNPNYVWQSDLGQGFQTLNNFGNYSGVNSANLNIANVQLSEHNQPIRVITTSGNCIDTSNVAVINILDTCITNVTVYDTLLTTVTDTLVINATITGINPPNNLNTLKVFPNPANTHITIDYGNFNTMSGYTLTIVNSLGQTVFTTPINQQTSYIDLSTWTGNGIYFVQLIDPQNNTIENRKIVIQ